MSRDVRNRRVLYRQCEIDFQLELSRGTSCISSCQTERGLHALVQETLPDAHGPERFTSLRSLLVDRLIVRGRPDAAAMVASYRLPAQMHGSPSFCTGPWERRDLRRRYCVRHAG